MLKKLNFWSKSYPNPTPFLGQYDSNHVQCGYVLVQYGQVLSLHLLKIVKKCLKQVVNNS